MKVVIIEDEQHTAADLADSITKAQPGAEILAILSSVKEAIEYFQEHTGADIIFSDIQLGDGLSFAIFDALKIPVPIIFCTAYDEYALQAFKTAGIDYVLKPFTVNTIAAALAKYKNLQSSFIKSVPSYNAFGNALQAKKQTAILVYYKDKILPVKLDDIAVFYLHNNLTHLLTFNKEQYFINETLEEAENIAGTGFYRANRQHLVNRKAIKDASKYFARKLLVNLHCPFAEKITVSKVKASHFLSWLAGE